MVRVLLALAATLAVAAGCGDDGSESLSSARSRATVRCGNLFVATLNGLDTRGIDVSDGLDQREVDLGRARLDELQEANPDVFDPDGPCAEVLEGLSDEEAEILTGRLDPVVAALLTDGTSGAPPTTRSTTVVTEPDY